MKLPTALVTVEYLTRVLVENLDFRFGNGGTSGVDDAALVVPVAVWPTRRN
jgi:hypothetical protein